MENTSPFREVHIMGDRSTGLVKPKVTFKPALIGESDKKQKATLHQALIGSPLVVGALIGIIILVRLTAREKLRNFKQQKWSTRGKNSKKSKKRVTRNLYKYNVPPVQTDNF